MDFEKNWKQILRLISHNFLIIYVFLMKVPRILFITSMPLDKTRTGSMKFMSFLLDKYPENFTWFSLRAPSPEVENPYDIPYAYARRLSRPARFPWLKHYLNLGPWARYRGYKAASFGRDQGVEVVLADLAFEAVVAGRIAAQALNVPLLVSVHDDPINRIEVKNYPAWLVERYKAEFAKTMRASTRCAVISKYMGEVYQERYGVDTTTLYVGVEEDECLPVRDLNRQGDPIVIGSVGSMNCADNWNLLIEAVRLLNQQQGSERYRILHIGNLPDNLQTPGEVEVTGWVPEEQFAHQLSRIDMGFINWTFDPQHAEMGRTFFPLKIHSYVKAQVPMIALGPPDSSVIRFVNEYKCGVSCSIYDSLQLANKIGRNYVIYKSNEYIHSINILKRDFSRKKFFEKFESFICIL